MTSKISIKNLPQENLLHILSFCDKKTLGRCCQVDRSLRTLARDDSLWKVFYPELEDKSNIKGSLDEKYRWQLQTNDEILDKIKEFVEKLSINKNGKFTCTFSKDFFPFSHLAGEMRSYSEKIQPICIKVLRANYFDKIKNSEFFSDEKNKFDITENWNMGSSHHFDDGVLRRPDVYITSSVDLTIRNDFDSLTMLMRHPVAHHNPAECINKVIIKKYPFALMFEFPCHSKEMVTRSHFEIAAQNVLFKKIHELKEDYHQSIRRKIIYSTIALFGAFSLYTFYFSKNW